MARPTLISKGAKYLLSKYPLDKVLENPNVNRPGICHLLLYQDQILTELKKLNKSMEQKNETE